ncbi:MAG: site-specific integrase [Paraglaciecola polaris]|uniref:site-specific integrase n=1 Tax=Paraglaciecola polaris TaxID=222814 RepID=UPI0030029CEB
MAHANTVYLSDLDQDVYLYMYDEVARLNGDCDPFPKQITTFFGQEIDVRSESGRFKETLRVINLGKDVKNYPISDTYSPYPYINYIAAKCWLDYAVERTPASINHLSFGLKSLSSVTLSEKALSNESTFAKEIASQLSAIILANKDNQRIWLSVRMFATYAIENDFWGFNEILIFKLDEITIPSTNAKIRVSLLDHENGPFTRSEVAEIAQAIHQEKVITRDRVLLKLAMQFGIRPIQLGLLRESDIYYDEKTLAWYINIPRVKGRTAQLRRNMHNFMLRELPEELASEINSLIASESHWVERDLKGSPLPRPLFKRREANSTFLAQKKLQEYAWHINSHAITNLFSQKLTQQLNLLSRHVKDEDGQPAQLKLTCYRFRYTLGTRMVMEGKTPEEVAIALDHGSTKSVDHYFRYNRDLIDFIDDTFASSVAISNAVMRWQGYLIDEEDDSIAGTIVRVSDIAGLGKCLKKTRCNMHPTVSCYSCAKFRPFKDANHEAQLQVIQVERDFVYQNSSGPVQYQLDEALEGAIQIVEAQRILKEKSV